MNARFQECFMWDALFEPNIYQPNLICPKRNLYKYYSSHSYLTQKFLVATGIELICIVLT